MIKNTRCAPNANAPFSERITNSKRFFEQPVFYVLRNGLFEVISTLSAFRESVIIYATPDSEGVRKWNRNGIISTWGDALINETHTSRSCGSWECFVAEKMVRVKISVYISANRWVPPSCKLREIIFETIVDVDCELWINQEIRNYELMLNCYS